jgi:hypothetical protein
MTTPRCLLLLPAAVALAYGIGDCSGPGSFCAGLTPGMVAFIGTPVFVRDDLHRPPVVTFQVVERLVGLADAKTVTVIFGDGYLAAKEPRLYIVTPTDDGLYLHDDCGSGIMLSLNDPFAKIFQENVANRAPAKLSVVVASRPGWVTIPGVRVQLLGNGRSYEGLSSSRSALSFGTVPSGEYELIYSRPHFAPARATRRLTVLPGSCGTVRVFLESASDVSGRLLDARGGPVAHARLFLKGAPRALTGASLFDWTVERVQAMFSPHSKSITFFDTDTASDGKFHLNEA